MQNIVVNTISAGSGSPKILTSIDIPPGYGGPIQQLNQNDVLSGRGGRINSHAGNIKFRNLVDFHKHSYLAKTTKKLDKVKIADAIVKQIRNMHPSGRFLKEDADFSCWKEIGDEKARKKAGQAMREKAPETRRELEEGRITLPSDNNILTILPSKVSETNNTTVASLKPAHVYSDHPGEVFDHGRIQNHMLYRSEGRTHSGYPPTGAHSNLSNNIIQSIGARSSHTTFNLATGTTHNVGLAKTDTLSIPEDAPQSNEQILGAKAAAFDRVFNPLKNSGSSSNTGSSSVSSLAYSSLKTSSSSQGLGPVSQAHDCDQVTVSGTDQEKSSQRSDYFQMMESNSSKPTGQRDRDSRRRQFQAMDREPSYLPSQLTDHDPFPSNSSMRSTDLQLLRGALGAGASLTRSRSLPGMGSIRDITMSDNGLSMILGDSEPDLNSPELAIAEGSQSSGWRSSSNGSKSNSLSSDLPPSDFSLRDNSIDNMSVESKRSSVSSWMNSFRSLQSMQCMDDGDLRQRLLSESSNRSLLSELSTEMLALDLADTTHFFESAS